MGSRAWDLPKSVVNKPMSPCWRKLIFPLPGLSASDIFWIRGWDSCVHFPVLVLGPHQTWTYADPMFVATVSSVTSHMHQCCCLKDTVCLESPVTSGFCSLSVFSSAWDPKPWEERFDEGIQWRTEGCKDSYALRNVQLWVSVSIPIHLLQEEGCMRWAEWGADLQVEQNVLSHSDDFSRVIVLVSPGPWPSQSRALGHFLQCQNSISWSGPQIQQRPC